STDQANLAHILPGYIPMPMETLPTLNDYIMAHGTSRGKHIIATLKAWYGDAATPENEYLYHALPKRVKSDNSATYVPIFQKLNQQQFKMGFIIGQNPAV